MARATAQDGGAGEVVDETGRRRPERAAGRRRTTRSRNGERAGGRFASPVCCLRLPPLLFGMPVLSQRMALRLRRGPRLPVLRLSSSAQLAGTWHWQTGPGFGRLARRGLPPLLLGSSQLGVPLSRDANKYLRPTWH